ncbi:MAG: gliding motility-associatede transport system auxiliary component [Chloroflexia bacterium]|jgi:ABC-type uncharacterized transport system involved in gliding motility auxiliary subunit|nr:gliding motility-associatede transport system auxiliary component [Chloroflexia bacterium]
MKRSGRALLATVAGFAALGFGGIALFYWAAFQGLTLDFGSMDLTLRVLIIAAIVSFAIFVLAAPESVGQAAGRRSTRLTTNALVASIAAIAIAVVINFISENAPTVRADWTAGGDFTLSAQTQSVLDSLNSRPGNVQAVAFLRVEDQASRQQADDLLREYSTRNRKLTYEIVDPFRQPARAVGFGITREGVVVFTDGQKREVANSITEREFTSAIVRLGQNSVNTVAFLSGHGERDINGVDAASYSAARDSLEQNNYRVLTWSLVTSPTLTVSDVTVLVIAEPQQALKPQEIQTIQGYLDSGGHLLAMLDPAMSAEAQKPLHDLLTPYGLEPVQGVALDPAIQLDPSDASILGPDTYPSTDITSELSRNKLRTAFLASLGFREGTPKDGFQMKPVVRTVSSAPQSWLETTLTGTTQPAYDQDVDLPGPVTLAGLIEPADPASGTVTNTETAGTRIVVFGDGDFASNNVLQQQLPLYNTDLFGNTVSYLAGANELVSIRPKDPSTPRTVALDAGQRNLVLIGTVLGLPLLVALAGVMMWWRRR